MPDDPRPADPAADDPYRFTDHLGPATIVHVTERRSGLRGVVVIDNVAAGPAIGGLRFDPGVTTEVCFRLARAMTLKNAMAGLRHGGAKSGIVGDPRMDPADKERMVRAFAGAITELTGYIPGPDMGTNESTMAVILDEIGRAVGLPTELGGLPLDELGATGFGLAASIDVAARHLDLDLDGARVVVQGYGNVGRPVARFLAERGCRLVATADSRGAVADPQGLDLDALDRLKADGRSVADHPAQRIDGDDLVGVDCEIWIPAAGPDVLRADNVERLRARIVAQGANIPATDEAEATLHQREILVLPDFVANAGGVICGAVEYAKGSRSQAFALIDERVRANTEAVLGAAQGDGVPPRQAALAIAEARVERAMAGRRWT